MTESITAKAFGKINMTLAITGRRDDGYHTLCSVMQSISICNVVKVFKTEGGGVTLNCDDPALPTDERNTAYRAAQTFLCHAGLPRRSGIFVKLQKRVPYQAGLGSASADAAGVLAACNVLFGQPFSQQHLLEIAAKIGADVPFCLTGGTKLAEGIGDIFTPLPNCPDCTLLILHPGEGVSTPEAYRRFDALQNPVQPQAQPMIAALHSGDLHQVATACGNVFEQCCPVAAVAEMKAALLRAGALGSAMSGSGTAVFGLFADALSAQRAREALLPFGWKSWLANPVNCGVLVE
ncbi:4-(cytidine 5'-diphospho)-2-C-methyl-D-erythritol kinase [Oscillospiraceae bacterium LTW-04]|nr:4-(cytidine 5'-diphospho)-2-C-methyl-D-erythritol kinase [Oscillospiraceae bacterium MB24-C1]